jgi:hypothetical protein
MGTGNEAKMGRTKKGEYGAKEEAAYMSEKETSEIARREEAQAHAGEIVAGSGERGKPRRMARMVSARLDRELIEELRFVAQQRNTTLSDLLREGAELIVQDAYADAVTVKVTKSEGAGWTIRRGQGARATAAYAAQLSKGVTTTTIHSPEPAPA